MIKRSLGFYVACFIGFLLVTSVVGGGTSAKWLS